MAKRPSLSETMKAVQQAKPAIALPPAAEAPPAPPSPPHSPDEGRRPYYAATREGLKRVTVAVSPEEHKKLKRLSADVGRTIEDLMREALADLFAKLA